MTKSFIIVLLIINQLVAAQQIDISGFIKDSQTNKIIPFSTVELMKKKIGVAANYQGKFSIQLSDDCMNDTLIICSLGYQSTYKIVRTLKSNFSNVSILLDPVVYSLKEVEIIGIPAGKYRLGNYEDTKKGYGGWMTEQKCQIAVFMDCKKYRNAKIVNASFFITRTHGKPETPFRVRVYNVDPKSGNPGDDLLHESLIVHGSHRGGWLTVDLSKYNLAAPSNGYFIAIEWIDSGEQYYYQTYINPLGKYVTNYGPMLSSTRTVLTAKTWLKFLGRSWFLWSSEGFKNSLIISEIEILK